MQSVADFAPEEYGGGTDRVQIHNINPKKQKTGGNYEDLQKNALLGHGNHHDGYLRYLRQRLYHPGSR